MPFIIVSKKALKRARSEEKKIVTILDDVGWARGKTARVKGHVRSKWAHDCLSDDSGVSSGVLRTTDLPEWLAKLIDGVPRNGDAWLEFNLCKNSAAFLSDGEFDVPNYQHALFCRVFGSPNTGEDPWKGLLKEFGERDCGVEFSQLVRKYIKEKFNDNQARAAQSAWLDPQIVNQIYNAVNKVRRGGAVRGVSRETVIALAMAFKLTLNEADELMRSAGYAFSDSDEDQLFKLCFKYRFYSISKINEHLQTLQRKLLGSKSFCN